MGNEQSGPSSTPSSSSTFSFLPRASVKKNKGIVVVKDGSIKQATVEEDEMYKRFQEIPKFLPILRASIGKKDVGGDNNIKSFSIPIFRYVSRLQDHVVICTKALTAEQTLIDASIKKIDTQSSSFAGLLSKRKTAFDDMASSVSKLSKIKDEIKAIQVLLEELVPAAETLNELLPPCERLPRMNLQQVLECAATPTSSSSDSTPRGVIEEIKVVDSQ